MGVHSSGWIKAFIGSREQRRYGVFKPTGCVEPIEKPKVMHSQRAVACCLCLLSRGAAAFCVQAPWQQTSVAIHAAPALQPFDGHAVLVTRSLKTFDGNSFMVFDRGDPPPVPVDLQFAKDLDCLRRLEPVVIQGGALRTWTFPTDSLKRVLVSMTTEGRTIHSNIKVVQGPDNTPVEMEVTIGKGRLRPFTCWIETPGGQCSVFVRNMGPIEFPILASVGADMDSANPAFDTVVPDSLFAMESAGIVQGEGSVRSYGFGPGIESVKVGLRTEGRPLNARIELVQGPNSSREVIDLYTEDGFERPFFTIISTPGESNMIRVINTSATMEFPLTVYVEPFEISHVDYG